MQIPFSSFTQPSPPSTTIKLLVMLTLELSHHDKAPSFLILLAPSSRLYRPRGLVAWTCLWWTLLGHVQHPRIMKKTCHYSYCLYETWERHIWPMYVCPGQKSIHVIHGMYHVKFQVTTFRSQNLESSFKSSLKSSLKSMSQNAVTIGSIYFIFNLLQHYRALKDVKVK